MKEKKTTNYEGAFYLQIGWTLTRLLPPSIVDRDWCRINTSLVSSKEG